MAGFTIEELDAMRIPVASVYSAFGLQEIINRTWSADLGKMEERIIDFRFLSGKQVGQLASQLGNTTYLAWYVAHVILPNREDGASVYPQVLEMFLEWGARTLTERRLVEAKERMMIGRRAYVASDALTSLVGSYMILKRLKQQGMFNNLGEARDVFEDMLVSTYQQIFNGGVSEG